MSEELEFIIPSMLFVQLYYYRVYNLSLIPLSSLDYFLLEREGKKGYNLDFSGLFFGLSFSEFISTVITESLDVFFILLLNSAY